MSGASDELLNDETRAHLATERALLLDLERAAREVGMNWKLGAPFGTDALDEALAALDEFRGK